MKNIKLLLLTVLTALSFNSCTDEVEAPQTPFVTFEKNSIDLGVEQGGQISMDVKVYTANVTNSDRTVNIQVVTDNTTADPAAYTVSPSIMIPAGENVGTLTIGLQDIGLDEDKVLTLRLEQTADIFAGEDLVLGLSQLCPNNGSKVSVELGFDSWPEEVAWRILDASGATVVASADPFAYGAYAGMSGSTTEKFCLDPGTYTIQIFDGYGDGGTSYSITANGATLYALSASGYTSSAQGTFTIN